MFEARHQALVVKYVQEQQAQIQELENKLWMATSLRRVRGIGKLGHGFQLHA